MVTSVAERNEWVLTDLLGRSMGLIRVTENGSLLIEPDGNARATMTGMRCGPFNALDDALAAIETHTRGVCRREGFEDEAVYPARPEADVTDTSTDISEKASRAPR